jgi:cytochrome c
VKPAGQWNEARIVINKGRLQHWLNGKRVVETPIDGESWQALVKGSKFRDWPFAKVREGHLALQDHGDEVAFRNLRIKRL